VTAAKTAAKTMASYGHLTTGLEYRPKRQPLLDDACGWRSEPVEQVLDVGVGKRLE
jgi:hypothetical protein